MTLKAHALINKIQFFEDLCLWLASLIQSPFLSSITVAWPGAIKDVVIAGYDFSTDVKLAIGLAERTPLLALLIENPLGSRLIHFIALATLKAVNLVIGEVYSLERKLLLSILQLDTGKREPVNGTWGTSTVTCVQNKAFFLFLLARKHCSKHYLDTCFSFPFLKKKLFSGTFHVSFSVIPKSRLSFYNTVQNKCKILKKHLSI